MEDPAYLPSLKRVGTVLVAVGLLDIGVMVYCVMNGISYTSSFNIAAVIGGIFLRRGSLRAASIVAWLAVLFLTGASCGLLFTWLPPTSYSPNYACFHCRSWSP